ncbi:MAG: efflux RND transporter permease subunit [Planctomycetes bacterium]|nr:efflux RND transporter permease subunit [Planctomycetota bacterium]
MMRWIIGASLQSRLMVAAIAAGLIFYGLSQLNKMPVDVMPEFSEPFVEVQTEALGLSAAEVEALITVPLEADMLNGAPWLKEIRSQSIPGLSSIVMIFEPGTDLLRARQMVMERLTEVFTLPNVSKPPVIINPVSSAGRVMMIGLSSEKLSPIEMSVLARWTIAPRLTGVNGVANVSVWGERRRQLQVQVDPAQLKQNDIRLQQIIKTAGNSLWFSPLTFLDASTPGTSGFIDTPNQRLGVRHRLPIRTPEELAQVPVEGSDKRLGDVAKVVEDHQPLIGDAMINGEPGLVLVVEKFPWANTVDVTNAVEKTLNAMRPGLAGLEMDTTLFRPATYIEIAVGNLRVAVLISCALIAVALGAFLLEARAACIAAIAILVSFIVAVLVLHFNGVVINTMVLAGLIIALGVVVDDAVVGVENMVRRLRQHRQASSSESFAHIIREASLEMRGPMLFATTILLLLAMPAFFLSGTIGAFLQPVAVSYGLALLASMFVALTVTPALGVMLLPTSPFDGSQSTVVGQLQHSYGAALSRVVEAPRPFFIAACLLALGGLAMFVSLERKSLIPTFKERDLLVEIEASPGTSLPAMNRTLAQVSHELLSVPGVHNVSGHVGRAVLSDKVTDVNHAQLWVSLDRDADYPAAVERVQQIVDGYAGVDVDSLTYFRSCVSEPQRIGGEGVADEDIVVRIYGDDWNTLRSKAQEVKKAISEISGIARAEAELPLEEPQIEIEVNMEAAKQHGVKPGDVRRAATTLLSGLEVGYLYEQQKVFDVVVWGAPSIRNNIDKIRNLMIDAPNGQVALKDVADVRIVSSPTVIKRETVARYVEVGADVTGRSVASAARDIESRLKEIDFPLEYRAELLRSSAERVVARNRFISALVAAAIGIFLVLQACVGSWGLATALFITLPAAVAGGALAAFAIGGAWSLGALLGLIAVLGIAVRNGLGLIKHYQQLAAAPAETQADVNGSRLRPSHDARTRGETVSPEDAAIFAPGVVQLGTRDRFTPILMTAVITAVAVLPLVFMGDVPGNEFLRPMAIVILGGLVTSTLFSLVGVPAMFLLFKPSRAAELEDLHTSLVGEQELRESLSAAGASEKELQQANVNH